MKRLLYPCLSVVIATAFFSCEKDALIQEPAEQAKTEAPANPYRVSLKDALETADMFLSELDGTKTRSHRSPKSIEYYINRVHTRAGSDADTLLYIVNYDDNKGFAILGADRRINPIYGFSNEGNLDLADTVNNRGLALCMENIRYSLPPIKPFVPDSMKPGIPDPNPSYPYPTDPDLGDREVTFYHNIEPMLAKNVSEWRQSEEFNKYCPYVNSYKRGAVGCMPLAAAQIMSYYEWPQKYDGLSLDWTNIKAHKSTPIIINPAFPATDYTCPDMLAQLLAKIGTTLNADYTINSQNYCLTYVAPSNLRSKFPLFGYANLADYQKFSNGKPFEAITNGPLLVIADNVNSSEAGHGWVIDGYISYKIYWTAIANDTHTLYYSFYHCVWGWGGKSNGYFAIDSETLNTVPTSNEFVSKDNDDTPSSKNFCNLYFLSNFSPIK